MNETIYKLYGTYSKQELSELIENPEKFNGDNGNIFKSLEDDGTNTKLTILYVKENFKDLFSLLLSLENELLNDMFRMTHKDFEGIYWEHDDYERLEEIFRIITFIRRI